ncbi:MAG: cell division ATP-binding protein FtsE [Armatimonadota bacterium]
MIDIQHVTVSYDSGPMVLKDVSLQIDKGEFVFLVGSTGAGKSTLLRLLTREILPDSGVVMAGGQSLNELCISELPPYRRTLGVVFQNYALLKRKTVWENVAYVLRVLGMSRKEIRRRTSHALELVDMQRNNNKFPNQLSGGEQQRVAIARALVNDPNLLLADEPTGSLDPDTSWEIMDLFRQINARGTTVLIASHDQPMVDRLRKRVVRMENGQIISDVPESRWELNLPRLEDMPASQMEDQQDEPVELPATEPTDENPEAVQVLNQPEKQEPTEDQQ